MKLKKSLGQNLLIDKNIRNKIISSVSKFKQSQMLIEIGAGSGLLTEPLSQIYKKLFAIEYDKWMCDVLNERFSANRNIKIIRADILKLDIAKLTKGRIEVFGNIPYYITGPIFMRLFKFKSKINTIFVTIQKEVARRILADPGSRDYGFFSCLVQYFSEPQILFHIKKNSFLPPPKVDSSFLKLKVKRPILNKRQEDKFMQIIRAAFNQSRKTIANALFSAFKREAVLTGLNNCNVKSTLRAEDIKLDSYVKLARVMVGLNRCCLDIKLLRGIL